MLLLLAVCGLTMTGLAANADTNDRETPLVRAVANCRAAVVNLRGRKTVRAEGTTLSGDTLKQVNGMGTGVIIDPRGYILTNYHVVEGVQQIQITTAERETDDRSFGRP